MKRNVYLAMKGLPEARGIFSQVWREKKTIPEEIKIEDALGRVTSEPALRGFLRRPITRLPWTALP